MSFYSFESDPQTARRDYSFSDTTNQDWLPFFLEYQDIINFMCAAEMKVLTTSFTEGFIQLKEPMTRMQINMIFDHAITLERDDIKVIAINKLFKKGKNFWELGTYEDNRPGKTYVPRDVYFKNLKKKAKKNSAATKARRGRVRAPKPSREVNPFDLPDFLKTDGSFQETETLLSKKPALDRRPCKIQE